MSAITYTRDEIISSSDLVRHLKHYLDQLKKREKKKFAISRNNKIEAVLISVEELEDLLEHVEIYHMIKNSKGGNGKVISLEEVQKGFGVNK